MRIILVDDEKPALEELTYIINKYSFIELIGTYNNPTIALERILKEKPDVVFLDVEMPEINGFTIAREIIRAEMDTIIVFVTAFDEYAIKAFEVNAVDYILKPFHEERIDLTIKRIKNISKQHNKENNQKVIQKILEIQETKPINKLPVWKNNRILLLNPEDIIYCTMEDGKTVIVTEDERYITDGKLIYLEEILKQDGFFRCHRSFLVNLNTINEVIPWFNNTYIIKMKGIDDEIPISRRHMKEFKKLLNIS
ncbi:MAG: response regulator transcription factor [Epulopiscium sp.]|nr:response regulator transcription factor [Candidatus Epulonipiscium sp.]